MISSIFLGLTTAAFSQAAWSQEKPFTPFQPSPVESEDVAAAPNFHVEALRLEPSSPEDGAHNGDATADSSQRKGSVKRSVDRIGADQKRLYLAPFKAHNVKWDALVLVGTGAFLASDRRIKNHLPNGHFTLYQDTSDVAVGGLAASLGAIWLYGAKTEHRHARETGELELETLVNTFLIYTPMQLIAGRQRPGEGNGHGDFLKHHSVNTSFPGGHAMFTWAMASVLADEYPKPWARVLSYGAAFTVTFTRFMAQDHWASDMFLGSALGIAIAENTFHSHCDPQFESQCKHHQLWWKPMKTETQ
jgi:membrane-associated phospholipid phosphatase